MIYNTLFIDKINKHDIIQFSIKWRVAVVTITTFLLLTSSTVNMNINMVGVYFLWMKIFTLKETFQDGFRKGG